MKQNTMKERVRALDMEARTLFYALRHPRTPWYAKALAFIVAAYALSPIDLIPDFIPVLGLLDDIILLPLGIAASRALIPPGIMEECREMARSSASPRTMRSGILIVLAAWALCIGLVLILFVR
ncbi:MAG: DUF1232 domain-containing protein [Spirochaetes bacterium]|nr:MAG: DUF1232 domain-containing protein [Spirochaetota bacterium]